MTKNIEDLLYRGDSLDKMSDLSSSLKSDSLKYRKRAQRINLEALIRQYIPVVGAGLIFVFLIWYMFLR
jgi:vesicle transport protein SEC22